MEKVTIIGGGLTGLSAAYFLNKKNINYRIYEKDINIGGLCRTIKVGNYKFDYTGHLLHLSNNISKKFIEDILGNNIRKNIRNSWIYSNRVFTRYPFQSNTYGLPSKIIKECLEGFLEVYTNKPKDRNKSIMFNKWVLNNFGPGIAKYFMFPYNKKIWATNPSELTTTWLKGYVPKPNLLEVITGALTDNKEKVGYNASFLYPKLGGINLLIDNISKKLTNINVGSPVEKIDLLKKKILINGNWCDYKTLISTIPLKELVLEKIINAPQKIKNFAHKLKINTVINFNLGVNRKISDKHWIYFPEDKYIFYRVGFADNFSDNMAPKNSSSIYTEISIRQSKFSKKNIGYYKDKVIKDLISSGILNKKDKIEVITPLLLKNAYVVYDKYRDNAVNTIMEYLKKNKIHSIGRYGKWEYSAMEDAILDGYNISRKIK